jgi:hypothetical protein
MIKKRRQKIFLEGTQVRMKRDLTFDYFGEQLVPHNGPFKGDVGTVVRAFADGDHHVQINGMKLTLNATQIEIVVEMETR